MKPSDPQIHRYDVAPSLPTNPPLASQAHPSLFSFHILLTPFKQAVKCSGIRVKMWLVFDQLIGPFEQRDKTRRVRAKTLETRRAERETDGQN